MIYFPAYVVPMWLLYIYFSIIIWYILQIIHYIQPLSHFYKGCDFVDDCNIYSILLNYTIYWWLLYPYIIVYDLNNHNFHIQCKQVSLWCIPFLYKFFLKLYSIFGNTYDIICSTCPDNIPNTQYNNL